MKFALVSAVALSALGFVSTAQAQMAGGRLFFEGDIIRGAQAGAPGPFCVLNSQFKRLEKVVFRLRLVDQNGKALDAAGVKSLVVELPNGQKLTAAYGQHPARGEAADYFWTAAWQIPNEMPSGSLMFKAVATDTQGATHTWEPFKIKSSQFNVVDGAITITPPPEKK
jgi:hypothetical protein